MAKKDLPVYQYEIISIDSKTLESIKSELDQNKLLIEKSVKRSEDAIENLFWINSFESIINTIDPYGTANSDSLKSQWIVAGRHIDEYSRKYHANITFSQKLGVVKSILHGKTKVTKCNPQYVTNQCIFHKRDLPPQNNLVFTLMPFIETWSDNLWTNVIKHCIQGIKDYPLVCKRADDLFGIDVMQDIYESILTCRIVIAEITNRNANVFYELGIAHALGKDVILLSQGIEHIPFDLNRFRHCIYENSDNGHARVQNYLNGAIVEILLK